MSLELKVTPSTEAGFIRLAFVQDGKEVLHTNWSTQCSSKHNEIVHIKLLGETLKTQAQMLLNVC